MSAQIAMRERRAGVERGAAIGDRRQRLEIDIDQRGSVLGEIAAVGDHDRDRLADIADLVAASAMCISACDGRVRHAAAAWRSAASRRQIVRA